MGSRFAGIILGLLKKTFYFIAFLLVIIACKIGSAYYKDKALNVGNESTSSPSSLINGFIGDCGGKKGYYDAVNRITLTNCVYTPKTNTLTYYYKSDIASNQLIVDEAVFNSKKEYLINSLKSMESLVDDGLSFTYRYYSQDGQLVTSFTIDNSQLK